jgi:hypothetical protein
MAGISVATHRSTAMTAVSNPRLSAALATVALLAVALLVVLFLAVRSGNSAPATTVPTQEMVQQRDRGMDHSTETIRFPEQSHPGQPF